MKPYLEARGYQLSTYYVPYPVAYALYLIADWFLHIIRPIHEVNLEVDEKNSTFYFNIDFSQ